MATWIPDLGNGNFKNPIIFADYSDPDVIRVGDDFFMIASSFNCIPGLPILHSKDLINWKIVNHAIKEKLPFDVYELPAHAKGIWAPSIRCRNGRFWIFVATPDEGIFMTTAEDAFGEWSPLVLVKETKGWIDPCPFWDEDGQAYLAIAFAGSRAGINSIIKICRMKPDGTGLLDDGTLVFDGRENEHHTIEGPKMYKRNGYYYLFCPAGGVERGWQTILRSKHIYGPYEDKIVMHQGDSEINGPHQGGWIELESGESWFLHFQDREAYGRIIHLNPVHWVDDWPLIGIDTNNDGIGEPVLAYKKPNVGKAFEIEVPAASDEFEGGTLGLQWQWQANSKESWYSLHKNNSHIRLYSMPIPNTNQGTYLDASNLLLQKFPAPVFTCTTKLVFEPGSIGDRAGLIIMGFKYACVGICKTEAGYQVAQNQGNITQEIITASAEVHSNTIHLRVSVTERAVCQFSYSLDGEHFIQIGDRFEAQKGGWMGAKVGIFHVNVEGSLSQGYADFDWFRVE